jgi:prevent-host-death family protein
MRRTNGLAPHINKRPESEHSVTRLDIHEAGERLADLIARARAGEEVIISENGKPEVRLVPVPKVAETSREKVSSMNEGQVWMADDFDDPMMLVPDTEAIAKAALLSESPDPAWKAAWRKAAGMWKDRDDIPELMEQLRKEWNRVEPPEGKLE